MAAAGPLHVACFKWGSLYSATDVNKLIAMFQRHLSVPLVFHCVTDDATRLRPDIVTHELHDVPGARRDVGNGRKLEAFSADFLGLAGRQLVLTDIDMVVIDDLDFLLDRPQEDFLIVRGRNQSGNTRGHAALYRLRVGSRPWVWDAFLADPEEAVRTCQHHRGKPGHVSDQRWLDRQLVDMTYFPDGKVVYFRQDCHAIGRPLLGSAGRRFGLSTAWFGVAAPPLGTSVVSFAGRAKPGMVAHRPSGGWRRAPFVARHWRE